MVRAGARGTKKNSEKAWSALEFDKKTKKSCFFVRAWPPTTTLSPVLVRGLATSVERFDRRGIEPFELFKSEFD